MPQILDDNMEIKMLHSDRELFHLAEVTSFYKVAVRYSNRQSPKKLGATTHAHVEAGRCIKNVAEIISSHNF